jgi:hypothetical protein
LPAFSPRCSGNRAGIDDQQVDSAFKFRLDYLPVVRLQAVTNQCTVRLVETAPQGINRGISSYSIHFKTRYQLIDFSNYKRLI